MKKILSSLVAALCIVLPANASHSDAHIHGHIIDKNTGEHLPHIVVMLKGTTIGVATDNSGHYFIHNLPSGKFTLEVSAIGYKTQYRDVEITDGS